LINRLPSKIINDFSLLERLFHQTPDYTFLRTFGCACWPHLRPYNSTKLEFRSKQCVFLGYSDMHKGYEYLEISTGRVYISRDVIFDEEIFPFAKLHPNAGARFCSKINRLYPTLFSIDTGTLQCKTMCLLIHYVLTHLLSWQEKILLKTGFKSSQYSKKTAQAQQASRTRLIRHQHQDQQPTYL
jgi:hypothetical protein